MVVAPAYLMVTEPTAARCSGYREETATMASTRENAQAAREAKLDELHDRLAGAVEQLVSGEDEQ